MLTPVKAAGQGQKKIPSRFAEHRSAKARDQQRGRRSLFTVFLSVQHLLFKRFTKNTIILPNVNELRTYVATELIAAEEPINASS